MTIKTNAIAEYTGGSGVTIDGVLVKDGLVDGVDVAALGEISILDTQAANYALMGPVTGAAALPTFRALVNADLAGLGAYLKQPANLVIVDPSGDTDYTQITAAMAAITDAADNNEYCIMVAGEIAETDVITAKNHVHVFFLPGASVTVTSTGTKHAVFMSGLTNSVWAAVDKTKPHIIRAGAVGGASVGVYVYNCGSGVVLSGLSIANTTTGAAACHGIQCQTNSSPKIIGCTITVAGAATCYGIYNSNNCSPLISSCVVTGGNGGTNCVGIANDAGCSPTIAHSIVTGGNGTTYCHGIRNTSNSPLISNCIVTGGLGTTNCSGIDNSYGAAPTISNCRIAGGAGGAAGHGISNGTGAAPAIDNCTIVAGGGGTSSYGVYNATYSHPAMSNCAVYGGGAMGRLATATIAATSRQDDSYQPVASHPYRVMGVVLLISAAAASSVTLTLRDATGGAGNALSAAAAVDATGYVYVPITGWQTIAAAGSVYGRLSASDATLAYTIYLVYTHEYATCYAMSSSSSARHSFDNCTFLSNGASAAVYVATAGNDGCIFRGGVARSGMNTASRQKAIVCQSSWSPGQVYNMVLDGGSTNLTAAAGTANGSNIEL